MNGRLSRFGGTLKHHALSAWRAAIDETENAWRWLMPRRQLAFWVAGIGSAVVLLIGVLSPARREVIIKSRKKCKWQVSSPLIRRNGQKGRAHRRCCQRAQ